MTDEDVLRANLASVRRRIHAAATRSGRDPARTHLVAVTKSVPPPVIEALIRLGVTDIGESRVQEADAKRSAVSSRARWHMVGHLQTNKVARAIETFQVFHSVDSSRLAGALASRAARRAEVIPCFIQVNVSGEPQKHGLDPTELEAFCREVSEQRGLRWMGLMTIPPVGDDPDRSRPCFRALRELRDHINELGIFAFPLEDLSMGMSGDFEVAVEEGATWVRVGTALFEGLGTTGEADPG